jgi:hypothetical protein
VEIFEQQAAEFLYITRSFNGWRGIGKSQGSSKAETMFALSIIFCYILLAKQCVKMAVNSFQVTFANLGQF